jgi:transglutaminase-like putative cysteine protease
MAEAALTVVHETEYRYSTRVVFAQHLAHLEPPGDDAQQVEEHSIAIEPAPAGQSRSLDTFGNARFFFGLSVPHDTLRVVARTRVRVRSRFDAVEPAASPPWESVRDAYLYAAGAPYQPAAEFSYASPFVARAAVLRDYALGSFGPSRRLLEAAIDLMHRIHADFRYQAASTQVSTPLLEAFAARTGVCQDFAHVMIGCLRSLGLAARYVSGYLRTEPRPGAGRLLGADASHAWVAVHCPRNGWVELDPTNDLIPATGHVRLAIGRDYGDVAPLRGVVHGGGEHSLRVAVKVSAEV